MYILFFCLKNMAYTSASQNLMCIKITWGLWCNADSASVVLGWGLRICMSKKLPENVHAAILGSTRSKRVHHSVLTDSLPTYFLITASISLYHVCNSTMLYHWLVRFIPLFLLYYRRVYDEFSWREINTRP